MASRREQLVQRIVSLLDAVGKPAGLTVGRSRSLPLEQTSLPATLVYLVGESVTREGRSDGRVKRAVTIRLEHRAKGEPYDAQLDAQLVWATTQLLADPRQGGLALHTNETELQWAEADRDAVLGAAAQDFRFEYYAPPNDPT